LEIIDKKVLKALNNQIKKKATELGSNNVLVHSDIKKLFLFNFKSKTDFINKHIDNLNNIFPEFNIWMPTFNYDFTKTGVFNVLTDNCQIGVLGNYYKQSCDWRTTTPVFNFTGMGDYPIKTINDADIINPFAIGSEFDYLYKTNSIICHYGSDIKATTFIHYVEIISKKLLYRYSKIFNGIVNNNNNSTKVSLDYSVTPMNPRMEYDWDKIYYDLKKDGILHDYRIFKDTNYIMLISTKKLLDYWIYKLNLNPFYFLNIQSELFAKNKVDKLGRGFILQDFE